MTMVEVLRGAEQAVTARGEAYGPPGQVHATAAKIWSAILGIEVTTLQVILCLDGVKTARLVHAPTHPDGPLDKAGYAAIYGELAEAVARAQARERRSPAAG